MNANVNARTLRAKALRVAKVLESYLGIPTQAASYPRPLDMLIATILSQNTNDKNSHRAYTRLRRKYRRWEDVANERSSGLVNAIRVGGMANQKSVRIQETLHAVKQRFGAYSLSRLKKMKVDDVIETLTAINGVGVKTASCVLLFSLGKDVFPVDTHVHRLSSRLGLAPGCRTPEKTFWFMREIFPKGRGYSFHTNLIRFGRRVCRSKNPVCTECPLFDECEYEGKQRRPQPRRAPSVADHDFMLLDNVRGAP